MVWFQGHSGGSGRNTARSSGRDDDDSVSTTYRDDVLADRDELPYDPYDFLGVSRDDTFRAVKAAYLRICITHHPRRHCTNTDDEEGDLLQALITFQRACDCLERIYHDKIVMPLHHKDDSFDFLPVDDAFQIDNFDKQPVISDFPRFDIENVLRSNVDDEDKLEGESRVSEYGNIRSILGRSVGRQSSEENSFSSSFSSVTSNSCSEDYSEESSYFSSSSSSSSSFSPSFPSARSNYLDSSCSSSSSARESGNADVDLRFDDPYELFEILCTEKYGEFYANELFQDRTPPSMTQARKVTKTNDNKRSSFKFRVRLRLCFLWEGIRSRMGLSDSAFEQYCV